MGHLDDPTNTFWELFVRSVPSSADSTSGNWQLRTPPGVASNGGLVIGLSSDGALTAGFVPSVNLTFSPLAQSATGGLTWAAGQLPTGLAVVPSGVASTGGTSLALGAAQGGSVFMSTGNLSHWTRVVTGRSLAHSTKACSLTSITAVALGVDDEPVLGLSCARGQLVGIATEVNAGTASPSWRLVGPDLASTQHGATAVVRLQEGSLGLIGLATTTKSAGATALSAFWGDSAATGWEASRPLTLQAGWTIMATAIASSTEGQRVAVLLRSGSRRQIWEVDQASKTWSELPTPPSDTEAVASPGRETDAFVVDGARLTIWTLSPEATTWNKAEGVVVPLQYGSSS
jgi:hypothetical protein